MNFHQSVQFIAFMADTANSIDLHLNQLFPQTMHSLTTGVNNIHCIGRQAMRPLASNSLIQCFET